MPRFKLNATPWRSVFGGFVGLLFSATCVVSLTSGLYLKPVTAEFGWTRGEFSLGISIQAVFLALTIPLAGWGVDRLGSRVIIGAGCLLLPLAMICWSLLPPNYPAFLALSMVLGIAVALTAPAVYLSILPQWFDRNLGLALSLAGAGLGFGQMAMTMLTQHFITSVGWRGAVGDMAIIAGVISLLNWWLFVRENPSYRAQRQAAEDGAAMPGITLADAIRRPLFWLLVCSFMLVALVYAGAVIHIVPLLTDRGYTPASASLGVVFSGLAALVARIGAGVLLDRIAFGWVGAGFFLVQSAGCVLLASGAGAPWSFLGSAMIGAAVGADSDLMPYALRRVFGMRSFGKIYGLTSGLFQLGPITGPLLLSTAFDRTGSYDWMLYIFAGFSFAATLLILLASKMRNVGTTETIALT